MRLTQTLNCQLQKDEDQERLCEMVLESYHEIPIGRGKEYNEFFDELEQKYSNR